MHHGTRVKWRTCNMCNDGPHCGSSEICRPNFFVRLHNVSSTAVRPRHLLQDLVDADGRTAEENTAPVERAIFRSSIGRTSVFRSHEILPSRMRHRNPAWLMDVSTGSA